MATHRKRAEQEKAAIFRRLHLFAWGLANKDARKRIRKLFAVVGFNPPRRLKPFHAFRAYFVKQCIASGIPISAIMSYTGHDTIGMVLHYSGMSDKEALSEFQKFGKNQSIDVKE